MLDLKHYVGETGTQVIVDCGVDLTASTVQKLKVKLPDGTLAEWSATVYTIDNAPNYLLHITSSSDFGDDGTYEIQSYIEIGGWKGVGETAFLQIFDLYK